MEDKEGCCADWKNCLDVGEPIVPAEADYFTTEFSKASIDM